MKRRGFLQMLGGALTAPLMPSASLAAVRKVGYSASSFHAAIYFAQQRLNFSVFTLAQRVGIPMEQAEAMMVDMSQRGILGPLQGGNAVSGRWATSHLKSRAMSKAALAQKHARANRINDAADQHATDKKQNRTWADMRPFLTHLHDLCRSQGRRLHPRCADMIAD